MGIEIRQQQQQEYTCSRAASHTQAHTPDWPTQGSGERKRVWRAVGCLFIVTTISGIGGGGNGNGSSCIAHVACVRARALVRSARGRLDGRCVGGEKDTNGNVMLAYCFPRFPFAPVVREAIM